MKRAAVFAVLMLLLFATLAYAGVFGTVKSWITGELLAVIATVAIGAITGTTAYKKIARTFSELAEFLTALTDALEDSKVTREELKNIVKEGKDVLAVWRK